MTLTRLDGFTLPPAHPFAGREAYQCSECKGISYPPEPDHGCPYCAEAAAIRLLGGRP